MTLSVDEMALRQLDKAPESVLARYRENYRLRSDLPLTSDKVRLHWILERELRDSLLKATPGERGRVFELAYTKLYAECAWLNRPQEEGSDGDLTCEYGYLAVLIEGRHRV